MIFVSGKVIKHRDKSMKVFIILPTYNEAQNIEEMVTSLLALAATIAATISGIAVDITILIIDDNSPDGTGKIVDKLHDKNPEQVFVMHRPIKTGLGRAYVTGFKWALERGADIVIQMDSDFSHSPHYLPIFIAQIANDKYDVVVGSRYVVGGSIDSSWNGWRLLLSRVANSFWIRLILGVKVKDATAGFKCWSRRALECINFDQVCSNGYVFQVEMVYLCEKLGVRVLEWPIYFEDRRAGKSKMTMAIKLEAVWRVMQIRLRYQ